MDTIQTGTQDPVLTPVAPPAPRRRRRRAVGVAAVVAGVLSLAVAADSWLRTTTLASIPEAPGHTGPLFEPATEMSVTVSTASQTAPWTTTDHELRDSVETWKRMHLADWNGVPAPLREQALDN